jgi:hypothetical protein
MNTSTPAVSVRFEPASPRVFNPWLIALAVVVPTFTEVLDTTIANVALRYIAGGLSEKGTHLAAGDCRRLSADQDYYLGWQL